MEGLLSTGPTPSSLNRDNHRETGKVNHKRKIFSLKKIIQVTVEISYITTLLLKYELCVFPSSSIIVW